MEILDGFVPLARYQISWIGFPKLYLGSMLYYALMACLVSNRSFTTGLGLNYMGQNEVLSTGPAFLFVHSPDTFTTCLSSSATLETGILHAATSIHNRHRYPWLWTLWSQCWQRWDQYVYIPGYSTYFLHISDLFLEEDLCLEWGESTMEKAIWTADRRSNIESEDVPILPNLKWFYV